MLHIPVLFVPLDFLTIAENPHDNILTVLRMTMGVVHNAGVSVPNCGGWGDGYN